MTIEGALEFVKQEIARIERQNEGKELRPWERDACPAAKEHWGRVQQRIALEHGWLTASCLTELELGKKTKTRETTKPASFIRPTPQERKREGP